MDLLPVVETIGVSDFQHGFSKCWRVLASGAVVHVVSKRNGLHRAWLVPELEPGYEPVPIGCNELRDHLGMVFELVRDGVVFEITDQQGGQKATVRGYLQLAPPEGLARLDRALQFTVRRRGGSRLRDIWPLETAARPS
jgi:hypothetical protein